MIVPPPCRPVLATLGLASLLLAGCTSYGPTTVARDRFDYSAGITESWKRQTLLNIVKLRYLDPPIFVDVGQIVSGYTIENGGTAGLSIPDGASLGGTTLTLGGSSKFTDRPTITYVPLTGNKFINGLLTPLQPSALFRAMQAGWPADVILKLGIVSINSLSGERIDRTGVTGADDEFDQVAQLMRELQVSGMVSIKVTDEEHQRPATLFALRSANITEEQLAKSHELRRLLRLDADAPEFRLTYGAIASSNREIAVTTRSLMQVLAMLATHVDVPARDLEEGRATPGLTEYRDVRFHSGLTAPPDAFAAVHYRNTWFWIDDRDLGTKRAFALIMLLFTMADTDSTGGLPVLTIPTG